MRESLVSSNLQGVADEHRTPDFSGGSAGATIAASASRSCIRRRVD